MESQGFKERVRAAMTAREWSIRDLERESGVPYHALHKFLSRPAASTNIDHAIKIATALGMSVTDDAAASEFQQIFSRLSAQDQEFVLRSMRGLLGD